MTILDELRRLHEAATPVFQRVDHAVVDTANCQTTDAFYVREKTTGSQWPKVIADFQTREGAEFYIALRNALPALLAVAEVLPRLMQRIRELGDHYADLEDAPDGAVPAWDLVALALDDADEALRKLTEEPKS